MPSLSLAVEHVSDQAGVTVDDYIHTQISRIKYEPATQKMIHAFKSFILLHSLETNFLSFLRAFFEEYTPSVLGNSAVI